MKLNLKSGIFHFLPIIFLLTILFGNILFNLFMGISQSNNKLSVVSILVLTSIFSIYYNRKKDYNKQIIIFCKSAANEKIILMIFIFILAGAFSSISKKIGAVDSLSTLGLVYLPSHYIYAGIFLISSFISFSIGTAVGTIVAMAPVAVDLILKVNGNINIALAAVVGASIFGDNLSLISDTTIAATSGLGCQMKDKFKSNLIIIAPSFILSILLYVYLGKNISINSSIVNDYYIIKIIPYIWIILLSLFGVNVITVLSSGIIITSLIGFIYREFSIVEFTQIFTNGVIGMSNVIFTVLMIAGIIGIINDNGGIYWITNNIINKINSKTDAEYSIAFLSMFLSFLLRGTNAIIIGSPIVKIISEKYYISPKRAASLMDIFATLTNAFVFWDGLNLIAVELVKTGDTLSLVKYSIYPILLLLSLLILIKIGDMNEKKN